MCSAFKAILVKKNFQRFHSVSRVALLYDYCNVHYCVDTAMDTKAQRF
jgi:hypothetical protein